MQGVINFIDAAIKLLDRNQAPLKIASIKNDSITIKNLDKEAKEIKKYHGDLFSICLTPSEDKEKVYDVWLLFKHSEIYTGGVLGVEQINMRSLSSLYRINRRIVKIVGEGKRYYRRRRIYQNACSGRFLSSDNNSDSGRILSAYIEQVKRRNKNEV